MNNQFLYNVILKEFQSNCYASELLQDCLVDWINIIVKYGLDEHELKNVILKDMINRLVRKNNAMEEQLTTIILN